MNSFITDLKVGLRHFARSPGNLLLAVVAYAVGLGLVGLMLTLLFGVVRGHPEDIDFDATQTINWDETTRHLWKNGAQSPQIRYRDFRDLHAEQDVFDGFAAIRDSTFSVVIDKYAERFNGSLVTADYFRVLRIPAVAGRFFSEGDDLPGAEPKAVISYALWQNHFGGKESVIGSSLLINGAPVTVIGVASEGFDFPSRNDIWVNETIDPLALSRADGSVYFVIAALKEGETVASATAALNTIAARLAEAYPATNTGYISLEMRPLSSVFIGEQLTTMTYLMLACAALVLVIACTNVANLALSRATTRVKELAIRSALGGKRWRIVAQMVVEGLSVAFFGGLGGLIIAIWTSKIIWAWANEGDANNPPAWMNMDVDLQVIAYLSLATFAASVGASIVPALQASRADINEILKDTARGSTGLRIGLFSKLLTLFQICISCGLLIATSAMVTTAKATAVFEPPYDPAGMMVARFDLPESRYPAATRGETLRQLQAKLEANPALEGVGFTSAFDMLRNWGSRWDVRGRGLADQDDYIPARHEIVSDNYFELLGIPILQGRGFESIDRGPNAEQVCVINEVLAKRIWPDQSPIGQQIRDVWSDASPWVTIIGVVPDTKMAGPGQQTDENLGGVYRPMSTSPQTSLSVFAKTSGSPMAQAQQIRATLAEMDSTIVLYRVKTVAEAVEEANFGPLFFRNMFGMFGLAALALASIGVYGVMAFSVRQRSQEFSIRRALGALPSSIVREVFSMGSRQVAIGLTLGAALGWALTIAIDSSIGGSIVSNVSNFIIPIILLLAIAATALYVPARFAVRTNLASNLHGE